MLYKFLLLNIISYCTVCNAAFSDCTNQGQSGHSNACDSGYYWKNGNCNNVCPSGHYCPGNGVAYCCPEPFGYSGEQSVGLGQCEAHIQCGSTPNNTAVVTCENWENNKCIPNNSGPQKYNVQWTYDATLNPHNIQKTAYGWFATDNSPMMQWSIPDDYHLETKPIYSPNSSYSEWQEASFEIVCVPNTKTCKSFNTTTNFPPIDCSSYSSTNCPTDQGCGLVNVGQGNGTLPVYQCTYLNDISASLEQTYCSAENINDEYAHWIDKDDENNHLGFSYWDISECKCNFTNELDDQNAHCYGNGTRPTLFSNTPTTPAISIVHTIGEHIIFNTNTSLSNFFCTKCQEGPYYVEGSQIYIVTECKDATQKGLGYWRKPADGHPNYCDGGDNGPIWTTDPNGVVNGNPCELKPCPTGKTTSTIAPIGSNSCQYSPQTEFCDANGCFQINANDFSNWNF